MRLQDIKKKKEFIEKTFQGILEFFPSEVDFTVTYSAKQKNSSGGFFSVVYSTKSSDVNLTVYRDALKCDEFWIETDIGHEIGHMFSWKLSELVKEPFISKNFFEEVDEKTATDIGCLLRKLWQEKKKKNSQIKTK